MRKNSFYIIPTLSLLTSLHLHADTDSTESLGTSVVIGDRELLGLFNSSLYRDQIKNRRTAGVSFQELLHSEPGSYVGTPTAGVFSLRGVNQDGLFGGVGAQTTPFITVFEDSVPLSTTTLRYLAPPTNGLDAFQVRRGVQNFGTGSASIAGSIYMDSKRPAFNFSGKSVLEYSEHGTLSSYLSQNIPLVENELALNLSYYRFETDGEVRAPLQGNDKFGAWDRDRFRGQLLWHPAKNKDHSLLLTFLHDQAGGNPQANTSVIPGVFGPFDRISNTNTPSSYPARRRSLSLQTSFSLPNEMTLRSTTAYQRINLGQHLDFDGSPLLDWTINGRHDERLFTQSLSLSGKATGWQWKTGIFYENSAYEVGFQGIGIAPVPGGSPYQNSAKTDVETFAWYGQLSYELPHHLRLKTGLRYQHDERRLEGSSLFSILPARFSNERTNDDAFLPSLSLEWTPENQTALSLGIARGYRSGGIGFAPVAGVSGSYDAEHSWDLELAARHALSDHVMLASSLFYSWMDDQHVSQNVPGGLSGVDLLTTNAGKSHRYGIELQAQWKPTDSLTLFANTAYLKTEFDELTLNGVDRSGNAFPNAPQWTASCGIDYKHSSGFFSNINYSWTDSSHSLASSPDATRLGNRSLLNARIGWEWERITCYVFGTNLLNDEYALYRGEAIPPIIPQAVKAAPSRMIGVGAEIKW